MGVLGCNVAVCENIMCSRHSFTYGHICDDHFALLVALGTDTNIADFFECGPSPGMDLHSSQKYFDSYFPMRRNMSREW